MNLVGQVSKFTIQTSLLTSWVSTRAALFYSDFIFSAWKDCDIAKGKHAEWCTQFQFQPYVAKVNTIPLFDNY